MIGHRISARDRLYYWGMVLPGVVLVFLFNTRTWPGILGAFQKLLPAKGWFGSDWVGLRNFKVFFKQPDSVQIIGNTLFIAIGKIIGTMLASILFALILNEVRHLRFKKTVQTIVYLPHFVSWVIYGTILKGMLGPTGVVTNILNNLGAENISILGTASIFPWIMIVTEIIKEFGWGAIIYLSAITAIDPGLYEAAEIDGASRLRQTWHVTLPGIRHIIVLNAVLSLGGILNAGFDQIFNMYNSQVMSTGDVIDTWVYRQGLLAMNYGLGVAVGLFKSMISMILTIFTYWAAHKLVGYKIF